MAIKTFDSKCYDLASAFLEDEPFASEAKCIRLAALLQQTIEDFIADERAAFEPIDPPGFEGGFAANH